jgi:Uma2 family endonuclease
MQDPNRLTVEEIFARQEHVEGRYELVDGHIVPHPDYVTLKGLAAPSNLHAAIGANLGLAIGGQLRKGFQLYVGAGAVVDRVNANVPDLAISCDPADLARKDGLANPRFVFEILSPSTKRIDHGRKVGEYLAIASLEAYVVIDPERPSITIYRPDDGPHTHVASDAASGVALADDIFLPYSIFP